MDTAAIIDALKLELDGYRRRGLRDRAAAVVAALRQLGVDIDEIEETVDRRADVEVAARTARRRNGR